MSPRLSRLTVLAKQTHLPAESASDGAPGPRRRTTLALLCTSLAALALTAAPASAATTYTYHSQLTAANGTAFTNPFGLAVDNSNNLWVTDTGTSLLSEFNSSGAYQAQNDGTGSWASSTYLQGLAYGKTANLLYAADSNLDDLWGVNAADASYASVDLNSGLGGGCCYIRDAVDNSGAATDGDLYVSSGSAVIRVDSSGAAANFSASQSYISANQLTGTPAHSFGGPGALATDSAGDVYVAANGEVDEFDSSGTFVQAFTGSFGSISSVAVDPSNGDVLIGDSGQGVVHQFDSSANFLADIDGSGTPDSSFTPQGLAVDSTGTLYVADAAHAVIDAFPLGGPPPGPFTVTVTASGSGKVDADSGLIANCRSASGTCSDSYAGGSTVTLTATPDAHYKLSGWSGAGCSGTGDCVVSVNGNRLVTASFVPITHTVSVTKNGNGSGTVSADSGAIDCGATCSGPYNEASTVTLTATPDAHNRFDGWSGAGCSGTGTCIVTVDAAKAVTASFNKITHTVTVTATGSGRVDADSGAIWNCRSSSGGCVGLHNEATTVTLTATPDDHFKFSGWSGAGCSGTNACVVSVDAAKSVSAAFAPITHKVSVAKNGTGSGTVSADSGAIDCGATCSGPYNEGSTVTLTATPDAHQTFTGWAGAGCGGTGDCVVSVDDDKTVHATFAPITHNLTINKAGSGSVSCDGGACASSYPETATVTLTANPDAHNKFSGWSGAGCSGTGECVVAMDADRAVTASFAPITHKLTVNKAGSGSVACDGGACASSYPEGATVTLAAAAGSGSTFAGWSGGGCSGTGACAVTVGADTTLTASFDANTPPPPTTCKKGFVKKHGKCVKKHHHKHHKRHSG